MDQDDLAAAWSTPTVTGGSATGLSVTDACLGKAGDARIPRLTGRNRQSGNVFKVFKGGNAVV